MISPSRPVRTAARAIFWFAIAGVASAWAQDRFPSEKPGAPVARTPTIASNPAEAAGSVTTSPPRNQPPSAPVSPAVAGRFTAVTIAENTDFNIAATSQLHGEPMHANTPTRLPGGAVITTEALAAMLQEKTNSVLVFDVLGGERGLPGAQNAQPAGLAGNFSDNTQREFGNYLNQVTRGKKEAALVFYCLNVQCWRSYNAALRAINLGYTQVYWYRGGIEAWSQAGLPTATR